MTKIKDLDSKIEFEQQQEDKKLAMEYFPEFFEKSTIIKHIDFSHLLDAKYLEYCRNLFEKNYGNQLLIFRTYKYLLNYIESLKKKGNLKIYNSVDLFNNYEILMQELASFSFICRGSKTEGTKNNNTNAKLLLEISAISPLLEEIVNKLYKLADDTDFEAVIWHRIDKLIACLENRALSLRIASNFYHDTWEQVCRMGEEFYNELGEARTAWRKERNNVCVALLDFYKELEELNIVLYYGTFDYENIDIVYGLDENTLKASEIYNHGIDNIRHSKNYFCYLTQDEKDNLREIKMLKKAQCRKSQY